VQARAARQYDAGSARRRRAIDRWLGAASTCTPGRSKGFLQPSSGPSLAPARCHESTTLRKKDLQEPVIVAPTPAASSGHARWPSGSTPVWPSSTSGARGRTRRSPCTSSATSRGATPSFIGRHHRHAGTLVQAVTAVEREGARRILACGVTRCCPGGDRPIKSFADRGDRRHEFDPGEEHARAARSRCSRSPSPGEAIRRIHDENPSRHCSRNSTFKEPQPMAIKS